MEGQDSEPLFGEDVYRLLRDDSLLHRTGSNNFAALIDGTTDTIVPQSCLNQQQQQGHQGQQPMEEEQQQLKHEVKQERVQQHQEANQTHQQEEVKQEVTTNQIQSEPEPCIIYRLPVYTQGGTTGEVVLVSNNGTVLSSYPPIANEQQQQPHQVQQQSHQVQQQEIPTVSWDEIDMEPEDLVPNSSVDVISNESFMALVEESSSLLPDTTSRIVPSLQPWAGKYKFTTSIPSDNKDRNKWCYSQGLKKLYLCPNVAVPVNITMSKWIDASITITPVFQQSQYRMEAVTRCYNCKNIKNCDPQLSDHVVHVEGEGCNYEVNQDRPIVKVPLQPPPPGEVASTLLVKLMCLTSCVGGPNRRPFCLVLTLRCNLTGEEIGRQILDVKCCKCPSRDMGNDAKISTPSDNNARTQEGQVTKIRKLSSELHVNQKRKKPKIKAEPGTESRYVNIAVPVEFELQVKSYVNGLIAEQILRRNQPNLLLYPEDE